MSYSIIKEFREFFDRTTSVSFGTKKDTEINYPTTRSVQTLELVNNIPTLITSVVSNRFVDGGSPNADVYSKLFNSVAFHLNPESTANTINQGLVRVATPTEVATAVAAINNYSGNDVIQITDYGADGCLLIFPISIIIKAINTSTHIS